MELLRHLDGYCERTDPGYWAEPVNALTNLSFILVALVMWRRSAGQGSMSRWLVALVFAIGVGSYLFHTHAQVWALIADVTPILAFILLYLFAVNRDVLGLAWYWALAGMLLFLPYRADRPLWQAVPLYDVSADTCPSFWQSCFMRPFSGVKNARLHWLSHRGGPFALVSHGAQSRRTGLRADPAWDALLVACAQRRDAGLDDRGLSALPERNGAP